VTPSTGGPGPLRLSGRPLPVVGTARMYVCGITPYDTTHVGHAATFLWADAAVRVLRHLGVTVELCRNVTDVDDDLLAAARERGLPWRTLATSQSYRFERDMAALRAVRPTYEPQSHNYVAEVVTLAAGLLAAGAAYARDGAVYFRGGDVPARAGLDRDAALALAAERGGRVDDPAKDDPLDAAVWQPSAPDEPSWPSPWGPGRPGWHAECTVMALTHFGPALDVHAGGTDLRFPHHAYEAAQAEALTGVRPFARAWLHVGAVLRGGRKMAKSTGNLVLVADLLERYPAAALRLLVLDRPWPADWEFDEAALAAAADRLERLYAQAGRPHSRLSEEEAVTRALLADLDVPTALDLAEDAGGGAARLVAGVLGLM
jgi:cysteinyl-tRNA synthetase